VAERDTITRDALLCPTTMGELGLRHTGQIELLDTCKISYEQSTLSCLTVEHLSAPRVGSHVHIKGETVC
jgi:hypothetical protein